MKATAVLLDVEGTTTSISFVYDVLFPYARKHMAAFLGDPGRTEEALQAMDGDLKVGWLKEIQGKIWEAGYRSAELKSHVFEDVPQAFRRWKESGLKVAIYSSGSVLAQKLLFAHTEHGDLTTWIDAYFDTAVGAKGEPQSYRRIADELGCTGLFLTDVLGEAKAAAAGGWRAALMDRPGNKPQPEHDFPVWTSLDQVAVQRA